VVEIGEGAGQVAQRDPFEAFFREAFPKAARGVLRLTGDAGLAEDLAAEACARAYAHWPRLDPPRAIGWAIRVATNLAIDQLRRRVPDAALEPAAFDEQLVSRIDLAEALRALPERQRQVVVLRYLVDLPEAAVAAHLGLQAGTVKSHTHRALASLRAALTPVGS
jgi:RNA polymerase sigma-70 factor (sigma-E family)